MARVDPPRRGHRGRRWTPTTSRRKRRSPNPLQPPPPRPQFRWHPPSRGVRVAAPSPLPEGASMTDVTRILSAIEEGEPQAAEQLLPLVYDELRRLAAQRLAQEKPGQTLQATALVHEAYLRLVDVDKARSWNSRGHFFA